MIIGFTYNFFTIFAGIPAIKKSSLHDLFTKEQAPIIHPFPISISPTKVERPPIQIPSLIMIRKLRPTPALLSWLPNLCDPVKNVTSGPISQWLPIMTEPFPWTVNPVLIHVFSPTFKSPVILTGPTILAPLPISIPAQ